jgi:protein-S-isoprenylcysteine O-methyltransferase Ste14
MPLLKAGTGRSRFETASSALSLSPLELGIFGFVLAVATLIGLVWFQGDNLSRLQRIGAYLVGGGVGGIVLLGSIVVTIRNICGEPGGRQVQLAGGGVSYECYSVETLWAIIRYAALACLGGLMLFLAWRRRNDNHPVTSREVV